MDNSTQKWWQSEGDQKTSYEKNFAALVDACRACAQAWDKELVDNPAKDKILGQLGELLMETYRHIVTHGSNKIHFSEGHDLDDTPA